MAPQVRKNVELKGGTGNDTLIGGGGTNTLIGGTGNDLLQGGPGTPFVDDKGNTVLPYNEFHGGTGNTTMLGGNGNDVFYGGTGDNDMEAGNGQVIMYGGKSLPGQRNHDFMRVVGSQSPGALMIGGQNDATMFGGPGRNVLSGGAGNNEIHGGGINDVLTAGTGNDTLYGGDGYEVIIGGKGADVLYAADPTRDHRTWSPQDFQTRDDALSDEYDDLHYQQQKVACTLGDITTYQRQHMTYPCAPNDHVLTDEESAELRAEESRLFDQQSGVLQALTDLVAHVANKIYHVPDYILAGTGPTAVYGSSLPNFILGGGNTTIYSGGADDTITGAAGGHDTFFIPPLPDNATVVFTAQAEVDDKGQRTGNTIPAITINSGSLQKVEQIHSGVRAISQIGVITGGGINRVQVNLGIYAVYDIAVQCTTGNDRIDLTDFQGSATVRAGSGSDTVVGGSRNRGVELDGGTGLSTYEVDGNGVQVQSEGSPAMLSVYVNGALQSKIAKTSFRRLSIQGQPGNNPIIVGPLGGFSFPELIASAGPGNKTIDASAVSQRVTLLGGSGNDTLIGGSGFNYFQGGTGDNLLKHYKSGDTVLGGGGSIRFEDYENFPSASSLSDWSSSVIWTPGEGDGSYRIWLDGGGPYFMHGQSFIPAAIDCYIVCYPNSLGVAALYTRMGVYNPAVQGPISTIDFQYDFKADLSTFSGDQDVQVSAIAQQGNTVYSGGNQDFLMSQPWRHASLSLTRADFQTLFGGLTPDFSVSGAPIWFGLEIVIHRGSYPYLTDRSAGWTSWAMNNYDVVIHSAPPRAATSFRVTPSALSPTAGAPIGYTVTALDIAGNTLPGYRGTVHVTNNDPAAPLSFDYTFTTADNGVHTFTNVTWKTAGSRTFSVVQPDAPFISGTATVNVLPGAADHFTLTSSVSPATAGSSISLTVRAFDQYGNPATGYRGTVTFTGGDRGAKLPSEYTFTAADNGVHTFTNVVLLMAEPNNGVVVWDKNNQPLHEGLFIPVLPAAAASFQLAVPGAPVMAGAMFTVTATVLDAYGNSVTGYRGTVHPPLSDGQTIAPRDYTFTAADNGTHTFSLALTQAGGRTITIEDSNHLTGSAPVTVTPLAAVSLALSTAQATAGAGAAFQITITARDKYNNIATGYRGTIHFSSSDGQATLLPDSTFTAADQGTKTFAVTFRTAGQQTLQIVDAGNPPLRALFSDTIAAFPVTLQANVPTANAQPFGIVAGPDGNFWFLENPVNKIGRITPAGVVTEFPVSFAQGELTDLTVGRDGNIWFTEHKAHAIGRLNPKAATVPEIQSSIVAVAQSPQLNPWHIAAGPDLNLWFTESGYYKVGRITPQGAVTEFNLDANFEYPYAITTGPDGNIWFTLYTEPNTPNFIGRIDRNGQNFQSFPLPAQTNGNFALLSGPDGNLWYTSRQAHAIFRISPTGTPLSRYPLAGNADPFFLTTGSDGNVWFTTNGSVGRITLAGVLTEFAQGGVPEGIVPDPAGNYWVPLQYGNQILRFSPQVALPQVNVTPAAAATFGLTASASPVTAGTAFTVTATAYDAYGNVATGYTGTVRFSSSDGQAVPPSNYTFTAADQGVHAFTVTLKTAGNQTITATDTQNSGMSRTATVTVTPAAAMSLRLTPAVNPADAGVAFNLTVTALDPYGNIDPSYTGTVHFSSSDVQALLPTDYTFTAADHGTHTFSITLKTAGSQTLTALDTVRGSITGTASVTVRPGAARWLQLTGLPTAIAAGAHFSVMVTARDADGNVATGYTGTVHFSPAGDATLPPDYHFTTGTGGNNGTHTFADLIYRLVGTRSLTVSANGNGLMVTGMFQVTPAPADHFQVAGFPSSIMAGVSGTFTITALDHFGNVDVNYRGTVQFTSSDTGSQVMLPADYTFMGTDNGVHAFSATLVTAGTQSLTAADNSQFPLSINGTQGGIVVVAAAADHFVVSSSVDGSGTVAGSPFDVTVKVQDRYGNTVTGYTGTVTFSSQDPYGATLPDDYIFQSSDMGHATFSGVTTLYTAGVWDVNAMDTANSAITGSANVTVTPAAAVQIQVTTSVDGGSVVAGMAFDVTVMAVDPYGNMDINYQGTVHFSSQDPGIANLPPDYAFTTGDGGDNGVHTFANGAILYTAGTQDVTATDTADNTITGSDNVTVTPASATHFLINAPTTATAGVAFDVTVTAMDRYGNVDVNYRGTVRFTSSDSDPGIVLPADYTFMDTDNGVAVFAQEFTLVTLGDQTITATDTINALITGTATITVQAPGPGASAAGGKGSGVVDGGIVAPAQATTPAGGSIAEGAPSLRLLASLGISDPANPMLGLEALAAARTHLAPLSLVEMLDLLFLEEGRIG